MKAGERKRPEGVRHEVGTFLTSRRCVSGVYNGRDCEVHVNRGSFVNLVPLMTLKHHSTSGLWKGASTGPLAGEATISRELYAPMCAFSKTSHRIASGCNILSSAPYSTNRGPICGAGAKARLKACFRRCQLSSLSRKLEKIGIIRV